jgi:hypothetical protein
VKVEENGDASDEYSAFHVPVENMIIYQIVKQENGR